MWRIFARNRLIIRNSYYLCRFSTAAPETAISDENTRDAEFKPVIGLEIHAQINAKSKLFSRGGSNYWASSNTTVNFFDCALPGTLPVLNRRCVEAGILTALALNCQMNLVSLFDRKHYFYSDLPAGYQITQQRQPLAVNGWLEYVVYDEKEKHIKPYLKRTAIKQIQLEHDSGKSIHDAANGRSLVDLNRAGVALLEIVCHHDMDTELEAACFAKELQTLLRKIEVCEGKLERGQFRVDANVSVHRPSEPLGPRTEVKNLNSFRFIRRALNYEIGRQIDLLKANEPVINETLAFDFRTGKTSPMRDKETVQDYRYMPEPNLPPLVLVDSSLPGQDLHPIGAIDVDEIRKRLPTTLLTALREVWTNKLGLTLEDCVSLSTNENLHRAFDQTMAIAGLNPRVVVKALHLYIEVLELSKVAWESSPIELEAILPAIQLLQDRRISEFAFMKVCGAMLKGDSRTPEKIVEQLNLFVVDDKVQAESACDEVLAKSANAVNRYKTDRDEKALKKLLRLVCAKLGNRYPEPELEAMLREKLGGSES